MEFERWVGELIAERYGTAKGLADAIGITDSAFSRAIRKGTLSVELLLRLAKETGESPDAVPPHANWTAR